MKSPASTIAKGTSRMEARRVSEGIQPLQRRRGAGYNQTAKGAVMEPFAYFFLLIPVAIIVALLFRFAAGGLDKDRLRQYVEERGGQFIDASWAPFGPGWFGEKSDRIYQVHYLDHDGNEHEAFAKTS